MERAARQNRPRFHEFALELEGARREAGLKPKELAEALFLDPRTVRRYLNGERLPTVETIEAWEHACDLEPGRLSRLHPEAAHRRPYVVGEDGSSPTSEAASPSASAPASPPRPRRVIAAALAAVAIVAVVLVGVTLLGGSSAPTTELEQTLERAKGLSTTYPQRTGGTSRTWSDYTNAGGEPGPTINGSRAVEVTCRIRGFEVQSGNQWWYLVASAPWRNDFFASADGFFNQRKTRGVDFRTTRFVDPGVPRCP